MRIKEKLWGDTIIICDGNFQFFASQNAGALPGNNQLDLWGLLVHELGHNLGLDHPILANQTQCAVMQQGIFNSAPPCNWPADATQERNLTADDIAGIQAIYGVFNPDLDGDGTPNGSDNCPGAANADQTNTDGDSQGDACDADDDNDGVTDATDNCPMVSNAGQQNTDSDPQGDPCDGDDDNDGLTDEKEAELGTNPFKADTDSDGLSDVKEVTETQTDPLKADSDDDGMLDGEEVSLGLDPLKSDNPTFHILIGLILDEQDVDNDGIEDLSDNCPAVANANQADIDKDGLGNVCDPDTDGDGILDDGDGSGVIGDNTCVDGATAQCDDNCRFTINADQRDRNGNGVGYACDKTENPFLLSLEDAYQIPHPYQIDPKQSQHEPQWAPKWFP